MNLFAIDCSNHNLSVALSTPHGTFSQHHSVKQGHSDHALAAVHQLLNDSGVSLAQLDAILFGKGPGAFTGLRIAAGIAMGLATAAGLPVVGIPTLDAIARSLPQGSGMAVIDARMGEVYAAHYLHGQCQGEISVVKAEQLVLDAIAAVAGDAIELLPAHHAQAIYVVPQASDYIALYLENPARYPASQSADLLYVRNKIALTAAEQREQKRG
ncbi:tRNA (adenosine(37)-N6)-threonylcarbamoyltransferase complex dimerization subunit type 1 TsaB [Vogesella sp. DC21W]|uniref:tRNA (Adenosine(37)-N6)-threonylcarbamoyltransferase complex dimerization subunit type 1 TsaB n=1 Tax=Vogesella aquatica TaxID=2984206 RepID=A0ABT5IXG3_9NEIS|nr:tRNA (adenosine(37)-N6)-threonylcarbamoyltransferase complex dimerization subunit type 1 TsaB [Vogesella aquatica]MDC7717252.1 tRNA (adenosine(37)-N6)-threonylcarbamoyltransferase complex dimerization subunit type 1 TsaB [Vogesella aquatica]